MAEDQNQINFFMSKDKKDKGDNWEPKLQLATGGEMINYRESWRIFRIMSEFVDGYQFLSELKKEVTIFGSARLPANSKYYQIAEDLGRLLGKNGFTTITGGGPGVMEAANKGAFETGGQSAGLNIQLPREQRINPYVNKAIGFYYFFTRKVMMTAPAHAFVFFPGGFGTLDEFFEVVDYMEMGQMEKSPIILVGSDFWNPMLKFLKQKSSKEIKSVAETDIQSWQVVDDAKSAFEFIKDTKDQPLACRPGSSSPHCQGGADWRIFRIMAELVDGFEFLTKVEDNATVLGTKSIMPGSAYYQAAYEIGKILAKHKVVTMTGGGPGIMEAANKGAFEAGGESIGIDMRFDRSERHNNYLTKSIGFSFPFVRKLIITSPSEFFIFFPGGFGTLHQLFEMLTLVETKKVNPMPILLYGESFWRPLLDFVHKLYGDFKTISLGDENLVKVIDRPEQIKEYLK